MSYLGFKTVQNTPEIKQNQQIGLEFTDLLGIHSTICRMIEFGWGLDRSKIYYRFRVVKSNSDRYNIGGELILNMDFNNRINEFYFYPHCSEVGLRTSDVYLYKSKIKLYE